MSKGRNQRIKDTLKQPTIGVLYIPFNVAYTETCKTKVESISRNGISPNALVMDYTLIKMPVLDFYKPIKALEKTYKKDFDSLANYYLSRLDGLLLPGDRFDVNPELYGETKHPQTKVYLDPRRSLFIRALIRNSIDLHATPGLGICGSTQQAFVQEGGKLVQHIPDIPETDPSKDRINHLQHARSHEVVHTVTTTRPKEGSHYYSTIQTKAERKNDPEGKKPLTVGVNSIHHQAGDQHHIPDSLLLTAQSPDGTVEALEHKTAPWIFVQYHPELIKRMDAEGNRTLDNGQYARNPNGDGKDYDLDTGAGLPEDKDYYASERLIEDLVDKAIAHHQKPKLHNELRQRATQAALDSEAFKPKWVTKVQKEEKESTHNPFGTKFNEVFIGSERY